jgi:hypothetical protein
MVLWAGISLLLSAFIVLTGFPFCEKVLLITKSVSKKISKPAVNNFEFFMAEYFFVKHFLF